VAAPVFERAKWQRTPCAVCGILHQSVAAYEKRVDFCGLRGSVLLLYI